MDALAKSIHFLGEGKQLTIPFFQRSYVWKKENWEELLHSFENKEVVPFLGSIIVKAVPNAFNPGERMVIDGQQRLTTITLLAKAILDSLPKETRDESGVIDDIKALLFYKVKSSDKFPNSRVRIQHSRLDNEIYRKVIRAGLFADAPIAALEQMDPETSAITQCYFFYREKLKGRSEEELEELHDAIFSADRNVFVLIALEHDDVNEQSIFDTINRAGVRLSTADIIKNAIFKGCLDKATDGGKKKQDVLDLYDEYWDKQFYGSEDKRKMWDNTRIFGNVERTNLEFLLYCVATIKWGKHKLIFSNLDVVYSEKIEKYSSSDLENLVHEIAEYGELFYTKILEYQTALSSPETLPILNFTNHVDRLLLILEKFGVQMFYPYVLKRIVDAQYNYHDESLLHDFRILESFVVRRRISGRGVTDYAIKCDQIIHEPKGLQNVLVNELVNDSSLINDRDFAAGCAKIKNTETAKIILFCIELYRRQDPKYDYDSLYYNYSLEHIMPKKWEKYWSDVPVRNEDGSVFAGVDSEKKIVRDNAIQSLGNYALLKEKLNTSVSNRAFATKVNGNGKHKGYREYASMLTTGELVKAFDAGKCEWNETTIHSRAAALIKEAISIWPAFEAEATVQPMPAKVETIPASTLSVSVDDLSGEAFDDPLKMLEEMNQMANGQGQIDSTKDMYTQRELIQHLSVQKTQTIDEYIKKGKIVPDLVVDSPGGKKVNYYKKERVTEFAQKFGWTVITDENRLELFMDMVNKMLMDHSYKPLLIKAMMECADPYGKAQLGLVVHYFKSFYEKRRDLGLKVEKEDSLFYNAGYSDKAVEQCILSNPYECFEKMQMLSISPDFNVIQINSVVWQGIKPSEITKICDKKLAEYFSRI